MGRDKLIERLATAIQLDDGMPMRLMARLQVRTVLKAIDDAKLVVVPHKATRKMCHAGWQDGQAGWGEGEDCAFVWEAMVKEATKS